MYSLGRLAEIIGAELLGNNEPTVRRARSFELAEEGDVTLASSAAFRARIEASQATAIIVGSPVEGSTRNLLVSANPKLAFARAIQLLHGAKYRATGVSEDLIAGERTVLGAELSIHPRVTIGSDAVIGHRVTLHSGVVIGDRCRVGDDTVIHANVSIYSECQVGSRCIIHSGAVIGADGYGFVPDEEGRQLKLLQLGRVIIEDDCEIGANCTIDRGGFGDTILRRGVKLDNLVQVGHNCEIGENTVVVAMTGFSGGTRVGKNCVIAGQVGTNQHVTIGDRAIITARTVVTKEVPAGAIVGGMTQDFNAWRRSQVLYSKLPEIVERLRRLEDLLSKRNDSDG
jgi:UDP-3-O-[3-hydroxymyristoyl] glucosamine N-acyltransferase